MGANGNLHGNLPHEKRGQGYPITNGEKTKFTDFFPEIYSGTIVDFTGGAYTLPWVSEMRLS